MKRILSIFAALLAGAASAGPADNVATVDVLPGWRTAQGTHMAALRITLQPGWKTYWRAPGDAGIPPMIDFGASDNVASAQFHWPTPQVMDQSGMRSIGYEDGVVVPVELTPSADGSLRFAGDLVIGVCDEICVPVQATFDATLPDVGQRDSAIVASLINRPSTAAEAGVTAATCAITPMDDGLTVQATLTLPYTGGSEVVVIEANDPYVWVSEADVTRSGDQLVATSDMIHASADSFALDRSALRFTVFGTDAVVDIQGCNGG